MNTPTNEAVEKTMMHADYINWKKCEADNEALREALDLWQ